MHTALSNVSKCGLCILEAVEEEECWRQYEAQRAAIVCKNSATDADNIAAGFHCNRNKLSVMKGHGQQAAHMDDVNEVRPRVYSGRADEQPTSSTYWMRKLDAVESADPNRLLLITLFFNFDKVAAGAISYNRQQTHDLIVC